jgi:hypothetical protein
MWVPFQVSAESVKNKDKSRGKVFRFVYFIKHARNNVTNRMKEAIEKFTVM